MATLRVGLRRLDGRSRLATWVGLLRSSRPVRAVAIAGSVVFALVIALTLSLILELRAREIKDAERTLSDINEVVAEATSRSLQSVDILLVSLVDDLRSAGMASSADLQRLRTDRPFFDSLRGRVAALPQLNAISIVDAAGQVVAFSRSFPAPVIDLADREHFHRLTNGTVAEPYLSEPVQNRGTGEWTVYLARRLPGEAGSLAGIVYAAVEMRYFLGLYRGIGESQDSSIALWRHDGMLLARRPTVEGGIGRRFDTPAFRDLTPDSPPLVYVNPRSIDGESRMVARRVVPGFPVAIATTLSMRDVLAEWRWQGSVLAGFGALLAVAVAVAMAALGRQFAAYEAVTRATRETTQALQGLQEVEAQLRQSQKLEAMGQMTSGVAHDFNNLLAVVLGNLERLSRRMPEAETDLRRYVDGARAGAERAAGLTQRLLAFSRRQPLEPRSLDVNETVHGMADIFRQTLGQNMALSLDLAPDLAPVWADAGGLESALLNLVVNARDAMPGGGTVTVASRAVVGPGASQPPSLALSVTDTGTGMAPEVARRALEPFFTTKEVGVGTGLGLPQVYGFVRQTGGEIAIDSQEGVGTCVRLTLPCGPPLDGAAADADTTGEALPPLLRSV